MTQRFSLRDVLQVSIAFGLMSCSSVPSEYRALSADADPTAEAAALRSDIQAAQTRQVDVLASDDLKKARKHLLRADEAERDGEDREERLNEVALGKAYLDRAVRREAALRDPLKAALSARSEALGSGAREGAADALEDADDRLIRLADRTEEGKRDAGETARESDDLARVYRAVQVQALDRTLLKRARESVDQARKEDAKKFAPRSLSRAEASIAAAEEQIRATPSDRGKVVSAADRALLDSEHALKITLEAKTIDHRHPEEIALMNEGQRAKVASLEGETERQADRLNVVNTRAALGEIEAERLRDEASTREKLASVRSRFAENEAEVYQQGGKVLIRLKGIAFASGKTQVPSTALPLLARLKEVVDEFPDSNVKIEGHTDSIGSRARNAKLAFERAKAIESYLSASSSSGARYELEGVGLDRPIASNKTAQGRAQNRRVDVWIEPSAADEGSK